MSPGECCGGHLRIALLLFADDVDLLASLAHDLLHTLEWSAVKYEAVGMRISTSESKALVLCWKTVDCPLRLGDELLPQARESNS